MEGREGEGMGRDGRKGGRWKGKEVEVEVDGKEGR